MPAHHLTKQGNMTISPGGWSLCRVVVVSRLFRVFFIVIAANSASTLPPSLPSSPPPPSLDLISPTLARVRVPQQKGFGRNSTNGACHPHSPRTLDTTDTSWCCWETRRGNQEQRNGEVQIGADFRFCSKEYILPGTFRENLIIEDL